jgi:sugar lactone lactonase YvrE
VSRVRKVDVGGLIETVAGGGHPANGLGDGGPATRADIGFAYGVAVGPDGSLYIADFMNDRVRKVDRAGVMTTLAGTDDCHSNWDGMPASKACPDKPAGVAVAPDGAVYIADSMSQVVRRVAPPLVAGAA